MKRFLVFISLVFLFVSCGKDKTTVESEFRVELTYVGATRVRITVAAMNMKAYYSYIQLSPQEENYLSPAKEAIKDEVKFLEDAITYFENTTFTDAFCYRGSRQFTFTGIGNDTDYRFILFQINPKTHELIGEPVEVSYHTKPLPRRDLTFEVGIEDSSLRITPSDNSLTYFWDYELSETIADDYYFPQYFLYSLAGMYYEYGFLESELSQGPEFWDFDLNDKIAPEQEYTLVIAGCEEAEFTTPPMQIRFVWHGPNDIEVVEGLRECSINY